MADCKAQLKAAARKIQKRTERLVEDRERSKQLIETTIATVVPALVVGILAVKARPTSKPKSKKKVARVLVAGNIAMRPVTGSIDLASSFVTSPLIKLVHRRVSSKSGRFVLAAGITAADVLASRQAKKWAVNQPRLREIEELGLATRLEGQVASLLPPRGRTRCNSGDVPKEWTELKEAGRQKRLQRDAAAK